MNKTKKKNANFFPEGGISRCRGVWSQERPGTFFFME
jgi:hypothetical protein